MIESWRPPLSQTGTELTITRSYCQRVVAGPCQSVKCSLTHDSQKRISVPLFSVVVRLTAHTHDRGRHRLRRFGPEAVRSRSTRLLKSPGGSDGMPRNSAAATSGEWAWARTVARRGPSMVAAHPSESLSACRIDSFRRCGAVAGSGQREKRGRVRFSLSLSMRVV
jgi:hypothetical protein